MRLTAPAAPPEALLEACRPLPADREVDSFLVHAFVYAAEDDASDVAYLFSASGGGETSGCGPVPRAEHGPRTDLELEEDSR